MRKDGRDHVYDVEIVSCCQRICQKRVTHEIGKSHDIVLLLLEELKTSTVNRVTKAIINYIIIKK